MKTVDVKASVGSNPTLRANSHGVIEVNLHASVIQPDHERIATANGNLQLQMQGGLLVRRDALTQSKKMAGRENKVLRFIYSMCDYAGRWIFHRAIPNLYKAAPNRRKKENAWQRSLLNMRIVKNGLRDAKIVSAHRK